MTYTPSRTARMRAIAGLMVVTYACFRWIVPVFGLEHQLQRTADTTHQEVSHTVYHLVRPAVLMAEPDWPAPAPARATRSKDAAEPAPLAVTVSTTAHFSCQAAVLRI